MTMKKPQYLPVFKSDAGLRLFMDAYERVMEHWPVPHETMEVQTDYGDCHVIACGPKQGEPVVMFHGMTSNSSLWYPTIEALSGFRVYCVDTPGDFGKSKAAKKIQTPEDAICWMLWGWKKLFLSAIPWEAGFAPIMRQPIRKGSSNWYCLHQSHPFYQLHLSNCFLKCILRCCSRSLSEFEGHGIGFALKVTLSRRML